MVVGSLLLLINRIRKTVKSYISIPSVSIHQNIAIYSLDLKNCSYICNTQTSSETSHFGCQAEIEEMAQSYPETFVPSGSILIAMMSDNLS